VASRNALLQLPDEVAPQLLDEVGIGPVSASTFVLAWSHPGRCRNEAAFARLAGAAPLPATSGRKQNRHRLNYRGDRRINSALYMVAVPRLGHDAATRAYIERRLAEGKTKREIILCVGCGARVVPTRSESGEESLPMICVGGHVDGESADQLRWPAACGRV
jgi:transposase